MYHIHAGKAIPSPNRIFYIPLSEKEITDSRVKEMDIHTSILMQSKRVKNNADALFFTLRALCRGTGLLTNTA